MNNNRFAANDIMQIIGHQSFGNIVENRNEIKQIFEAHNFTIRNASMFDFATDMFLYGVIVGIQKERKKKQHN